jgi:predicted nuclease of predicted toxin-antitoxin system
VKLLFDQNLSYQLVRRAGGRVSGLRTRPPPRVWPRSDDLAIWKLAAREGYTVVSKDADFQQLAMLQGPPPKVAWIRLGNGQVDALEALLRQGLPAVQEFLADPALAVLALPVQLVR